MLKRRGSAADAAQQDGAALQKLARYPTAKPQFTLADVRKAIPAHCFERSTLRSSLYLATDVLICGALWWVGGVRTGWCAGVCTVRSSADA